jgi:hypothetical protein
MDCRKVTIDMSTAALSFSKIDNTSGTYYKAENDARAKQSKIELLISSADFEYGDVYAQFYDKATEKDRYCAPIIVQVTNMPTIYLTNIYKWRPTSVNNTIADYDNIFTSSFGSVSANKPDTGRTDVFYKITEQTECYNDFMQNDRLITNGLIDEATLEESIAYSISGHPIYALEYRSFVPSAMSYVFGNNAALTDEQAKRNSIGFAFADTSAYLTSAIKTSANDFAKMLAEDEHVILSAKAVEEQKDYNILAISSTNAENNVSIVGHYIKFNVYATSGNKTKTDKWYREHTRICADFKLTGVDKYWMSND